MSRRRHSRDSPSAIAGGKCMVSRWVACCRWCATVAGGSLALQGHGRLACSAIPFARLPAFTSHNINPIPKEEP